MKKRLIFKFVFVIIISVFVYTVAYAQDGITKVKLKKVENRNCKSQIISNKLFSFSLPSGVYGEYAVKKQNNALYIYDKVSKKAGFGGFAFGVKAYENPADHAMMPGGKKLGELTDKKGTLYDMVLIQPTDVQFDYVNGKSSSYDILYNYAEKVSSNIKGVKGSEYYKDKGMKGENLYKDVLKKHITAIKEKWDSEKLEQENMSYMYNVLSSADKNVLNTVGYAYYDVNVDGIDELFIGEIAKGSLKGVVYDIYTMVDRKPVHVVSGGSRNRYFVCDDAFICNEYSAGANENGTLVYSLVENSTELFPQVGFKYDGYTNKKNPWFITYGNFDNDWDNIPPDTFKERKAVFERYKRFDYIPLSEFK